jgi:hypothetical protein
MLLFLHQLPDSFFSRGCRPTGSPQTSGPHTPAPPPKGWHKHPKNHPNTAQQGTTGQSFLSFILFVLFFFLHQPADPGIFSLLYFFVPLILKSFFSQQLPDLGIFYMLHSLVPLILESF